MATLKDELTCLDEGCSFIVSHIKDVGWKVVRTAPGGPNSLEPYYQIRQGDTLDACLDQPWGPENG